MINCVSSIFLIFKKRIFKVSPKLEKFSNLLCFGAGLKRELFTSKQIEKVKNFFFVNLLVASFFFKGAIKINKHKLKKVLVALIIANDGNVKNEGIC